MFGTLHCNRQTNDVEFVERPDGLSKLEKHTACDRCRAKKVKCINQDGDCSRCKSLEKTCTFRINEQGRLRKRRQRTASIAQRDFLLNLSNQLSSPPSSWSSKDTGQAEENEPGTTSPAFSSPARGEMMSGHQMPPELVSDKASSITPNFDLYLFDKFTEHTRDQEEEISTLPISPGPFFPTVLPGTNTEPTCSTGYKTTAQRLTPSSSSSDELLYSPQSATHSSYIDLFYETGPDTTSTAKHVFSDESAGQPCQCLALAVFSMERCEASCNSASRAELDSIVSCQKEAIKSCRSMLGCGICMAKRENIYLWIVMIEKIVAICGQIVTLYRMTHDKPAGSEPHASPGYAPTNESPHRSQIRDLDLPTKSASPYRSASAPDWQELLLGDYEISSITEWNHVVGVIVLLQFKMVMEILEDIKFQASIILEETQKAKLEQSKTRISELVRAIQCFQMGYIRLVSILPGTGDLRLQFQPEATRLGHHAIDPFEALSLYFVEHYGTRKSDNESHHQTISITQNLATALQHLRHQDEARILWIDAICIDQSNLQEKSHQVAFMGEIYKHARQVVVWLGPAANNSGRALKVLGEIGSQVTVDWLNSTMSPNPGARDATLGLAHEPFPSYFTPDDASAVEALWARTWFERVWVRQEVALATSAVFQAGHDFLDRILMQNAAVCFYRKNTETPIFTGKDDGATILEGSSSSSSSPASAPSPFSPICGGARVSLVNIMWMHCGNPRDRVYGMLSLLSGLDNEASDFVPNYLAPVADCYRDLALRHITAERSLNLLASCNLPKRAGRLLGLPSWVPDWSVDSDRHLCGSPIMDGQPFLASTKYLGDGVLRVSGVCCGIVSATSVVDVHSSSAAMFYSLRTACRHLDIPFAHSADEKKTNPLIDEFCESFEPRKPDIVSTQIMVRTIDRMLSLNDADFSLESSSPDGSDGPGSDIILVAKSFRGKLAGRKLFKTLEGHLGIGPAYMQPGDRICLLLGSEFLIALRPQYSGIPASDAIPNESGGGSSTDGSSTSQTGEQFLVVGECFVPGLMAGEPLLGLLPPHERLIMRAVDGEDDWQTCLLDTRSGEATLRDPRIQTLERRLSNALQEKGAEAVVIEPCDKLHGDQGELRYEVKPKYFSMLGINMRHFDLA
ncbi:HET-domain-containing protein [Xylariaceae sp. AK1471]|nr:HET-domain-containing protein [Xylariaceae sp. AK1471]